MKKIYSLFAFLLLSGAQIFAQNVSFSIKAGSTPSSVKVFLRSNTDITGVVSQTLLTFTLPASISPMPNATFTLNPTFSHLTQTQNPASTETIDGVSYYVYNFYSAFAGATQSTLAANTEVEFGEVRFDYEGSLVSNVRLVNLPDGGATALELLVWEVGGDNKGNSTELVYGPSSVVSQNGYSGLSFVPLEITLPVKILSFFAIKSGDAAKLNWTVENDGDNQYFEIERSADGRTYASFTKVNALNNGKSVNTYESIDASLNSVGSKVVYYRIKQVDKSGTVTYSNIRNLNLDKTQALSLYPNPARTTTKLILDAAAAGKASISIRDAAGKQLQLLNIQLVKGINQQNLNVQTLPAGEYNVTVIGTNLNETIKLSRVN